MGRFFLPPILLSGTALLLFFPVYVDVYAHTDINRKIFSFSVCLYRRVKVYGGYISAYPGGLAVHTSKKKAKLFPYSGMKKERERQRKFYRAAKWKELYFSLETGAEYLLSSLLVSQIASVVFFARGERKEGGEIRLSNGDTLRAFVRARFFLNGYTLIKTFLKEIGRK